MPTWKQITDNNPQHSVAYAQRWDRIEAEGKDIYGEARLVDALVDRKSQILDVGCGQGRIGGYLVGCGHAVTGVDIDPYLIDVARSRHPEATWDVADLVADELPAGPFDAVVSTGNVFTFLAPGSQGAVLEKLAGLLKQSGRLVLGFGLDRGYSFDQFEADWEAAGLRSSLLLECWDLRPFTRGRSSFVVAILEHAEKQAKPSLDLGLLKKF